MESEGHRKAVGIWIRVSTEDQAHGESPLPHETRARLYAEAKGWTIKEIYDLSGVRGKSVMAHPEAERMLADIRSRHITGLIFFEARPVGPEYQRTFGVLRYFPRAQRRSDLAPGGDRYDLARRPPLLHHDRGNGPMGAGGDCRAGSSVPIRAKLGKNLGGQATLRLPVARAPGRAAPRGSAGSEARLRALPRAPAEKGRWPDLE